MEEGAERMNRSADTSDTVLGWARVREVTGVFHSRGALDVAAGELLLMGFDRADIDVVASLDEIRKRLGAPYIASEELADVPRTPRRPFIAREDVSTFNAVVASILGAAASMATAYFVLARGAGGAEAALAAPVVGSVGAGARLLWGARVFGRHVAP